jgi:hypothetical protein
MDWRNVVGLRHSAEAGRVAVGRELRHVARTERAACCMMSKLSGPAQDEIDAVWTIDRQAAQSTCGIAIDSGTWMPYDNR